MESSEELGDLEPELSVESSEELGDPEPLRGLLLGMKEQLVPEQQGLVSQTASLVSKLDTLDHGLVSRLPGNTEQNNSCQKNILSPSSSSTFHLGRGITKNVLMWQIPLPPCLC